MRVDRVCLILPIVISLGGPAEAQFFQNDAARYWSGIYAGGHLAMVTGSVSKSALGQHNDTFVTSNAGLHVGYNHSISQRYVLGIEADAAFPNFLEGDDTLAIHRRGSGFVREKVDHLATVRGRFGYVSGQSLAYATAGLAWAQARLNDSLGAPGDGVATRQQRFGWVAGTGIEHSLGAGWSTRLEYLYHYLGRQEARVPSGTIVTTALDLHTVRAGLTYHLSTGNSEDAEQTSRPASGRGANWNIHGQSTIVVQGYPSFRSPYEGANSLSGSSQIRNTGSASAFFGLRLSPQTEFYINPEIYHGFGLSDVHGLAGFSNGEAQKSSFPIPRSNIARLFVRHTIGLDGEQEKLEDGPNQIAGSQDISRLTITAGKLAVKDYFDVNTYANDPRVGFLNWNMYGGGSYDWTMDKLSWTWGALAELNQKAWAFRAGYFLVPSTANSNTYDPRALERGEYVAEVELRYSLLSMSGKARVFGWANQALMGSYSESLLAARLTGDTPDLATTRRGRTNYGIVFGLEQALTGDLGIFSRASWSPGKAEIIGWTDVHDSVSVGAVFKGTVWGRPADRLGVGAVSQGLSRDARQYFSTGGLGILIGDGALNYRREQVIETYYAYSLGKSSTISADYQLVLNPAYNIDRGPVSIYSMRLHAEF